ncbi:SCP2 sterol-binding domain-containing protein [Limnobacter humi]|uniref:Ubiquinone biosynthesis accessory factor UbiJ n=1 Tax=Limnobacter humi TaxID=1778671 RepID=A0ABT1WDF5_9BURK|nr:SCP2 sterol-binding domain-containing protein [Limnobacter humi]MCQ8894893.1 SCP2 sterol-binding domain-containing protein [Limnobacter humi]
MALQPPPFLQFANRLLAASPLKGLAALPGLGQLASMPSVVLSASVAKSVTLVLNHLLEQQRSSKSKLQREAGKVLMISIQPVQLVFRINDQGHFQTTTPAQGVQAPFDTEIRLQWADLVNSVGNPGGMARKASISGDMDFAQVVSGVINDLSWDPERDLARVVGDAQAVWIMNSLAALGTNGRDVFNRFKSSLKEYVVHEKAIAPTPSEFDAFRSDVSRLRDELARLEKRISKLDTATDSKP